MRIDLTKYHIYQVFGFILSLFTSLILIRTLGKEEYGFYSYYLAFAQLLITTICLGYDQSINLIKDIAKLTPKRKVSAIFNAKVIVYLLLFFLSFIFFKNSWELLFFISLISFFSLFDLSYFYMMENKLTRIALNFFISKLIFLLSALILLNFTKNYISYLLLFAFSYGVYVLIGNLTLNIKNSFNNKISFISSIKLIINSLPMGFTRIFVFIEIVITLTIFKNLLSTNNFGIFMISYSIATLISGLPSIFIMPIYNKITLNLTTLKKGLLELVIIGLLFFLIIIVFFYFFNFSFLSNLLNIETNELDKIIQNSVMYAFFLYSSSVTYNLIFLSKNKANNFYTIRIFYLITLYYLVHNHNFSNIFFYLISTEILIFLILLFIKLIKLRL